VLGECCRQSAEPGPEESPGLGLRTTNALKRINEEFRRRTKTQASLPGQDAVLLLLFGLLRSGQVKLRALVGYQDMGQVKRAA
jgi:hypothetical protein